jgi:hypothetical protein
MGRNTQTNKNPRVSRSTNFDLDIHNTLMRNMLPGDSWGDVVNRWVREGFKSQNVKVR